jgi:hypothetical protein
MVEDRIKVWKELGKLEWDPEPSDMVAPQFAEKL